MALYPTAENSSFRGFLSPGTGIPFSFDNPSLGFDLGWWDEPVQSGQELTDLMQQVVAAICGLDGELVIERWQEEPPILPPVKYQADGIPGVDAWGAIGVVGSKPLGYSAAIELNPGAAVDTGFSSVQDWETFDVVCSFYGPRADYYATILRLGIVGCAQNRENFQLLGLGFMNTSGRTRVPTLIKNIYMNRVDITLFFSRQVQVYYPVLYLLKGPATVRIETGLVVNDGF